MCIILHNMIIEDEHDLHVPIVNAIEAPIVNVIEAPIIDVEKVVDDNTQFE